MEQYLNLLQHVKENGVEKGDRTGVGTLSVFGYQMRFSLAEGFPISTTKKVFFKGLACEMLWFLRGGTNIRYLNERGVNIWDAWADEEGDLGPIYGKQWRAWPKREGGEVDQLAKIVDQIKSNPNSRRHVVSAWNVAQLDQMALPPCHLLFQFYVVDEKLSLQIYIRSNDLFIGAPFNIAQYALLAHMVAQQCDLNLGDLVYSIGDAHIYLNHLEQVDKQLSREPYPLPTLRINRRPPTLFEYRYDDFELSDYEYHPKIEAPVAV